MTDGILDSEDMGIFDRDGNPISVRRWGELRENPDYKRVDYTAVGPDAAVSTVWIGMDHGWGMTERPLIFETMVFSADEAWDRYCMRYATAEEAQAGHLIIVEMVKS